MASCSHKEEFIPDGLSCDSCNDLFSNPTSRSIIIANSGRFRYCREYNDLKRTAAAGCILCMNLLDRHDVEGTQNAPRELRKSINCPCCTKFDNSIVFLVSRALRRSNPAFRETHWGLSFRGHRQHKWGRRSRFWELEFNVAADTGKSTKGSV